MADILTELFATFSSQEQAQIRAAEASAKIILAQGDRAVREREMGSLSDRDYILTPRDEARAGAACAEFVGYQRVLNGRADPLSRESVQEFLGQLDKVCEGVLKRYGYHEGKPAIDELRAEAERLAWVSHAKRLAAAKTPARDQRATAVPAGASAAQVGSSGTESKRAPAEEYAAEEVFASSKKMDESRFSGQHKAEFRDLLAMGIELHANNLHLQKQDFGPWTVRCDDGDSQTKVRLKARFRAAARKAASTAGAPYRVNLLDWWISKLARGQRRPYLEGLIQLSIEYCEELESNAFELRPLIQENSAAPGLNRDRYPCDSPIPYWLYSEPHSPLADPHEEFAYWEKRIWQSFDSAVEEIASRPRIRRRWVAENGNKHLMAAEDIRRRIKGRVDTRTEQLDALILGLSYDVAVLQANYVIDRGFRGDAGIHKFEDESAELTERVRLSRRRSSKRLGLSWRKQDKRGVDLARPFREVGADLHHLASRIPANEFGEIAASRESDKGAIPVGQPIRSEIKKSAEGAFAVVGEDILKEYAEKKNQVLGQVRLTGNSGGYLPALTKWGEERLRRMVLAYADASVEAFTLYSVPSDVQAEQDLQTSAQQMAAGTISAVRGELDLVGKRAGILLNDQVGHLNREIHAAMKSAVKKGALRLRQQRIRSKHSEGIKHQGFQSLSQLMSRIGQRLNPEESVALASTLSELRDLEAQSHVPTLNRMLRMAGRMEMSDEEFRSHLPALLQELGLEIPDGLLKPPAGRAGRPHSERTSNIRKEWIRRNKPKITAMVCDQIAKQFFAAELRGVGRGSPQHKKARERVRQALKRFEPPAAT